MGEDSINSGSIFADSLSNVASASYVNSPMYAFGTVTTSGTGLTNTAWVNPDWGISQQQANEVARFRTFTMTGEGNLSDKEIKHAQNILNKIKDAKVAVAVKEGDAETVDMKAKELRDLGFDAMAEEAEAHSKKILKEIFISMAGYQVITAEQVNKYNNELREKGMRLKVNTPADYKNGVPPQAALTALKTAKDAKLFDAYEIWSVEKVPDPILVGTIKESNDFYFIAEWGDDIKLADLIK